ncbi:VanW family protein [Candidatus Peregrinibacteria bacterium]|nr:VanW family protein [Candidatus Peregrinibacteria bacterium]
MRYITRSLFILGAFLCFPTLSLALDLPDSLILKTDFRIWEINPQQLDLLSDYQKTDFGGLEVAINREDAPLTSELISNESIKGLDSMKIRHYLETVVAPEVYRAKEDVTIDMNQEGKVIFEGTGLYGRQLDLEAATKMMEYALKHDLKYVHLPLLREDPVVTVLSDKLKEFGIKELISGGETDFSYSPYNRISNINTGLSKFSGHIVKPGEEFVFGNVLGPVDASTGFLRELVIKGDKTVPEFGGGLCQVSTTAYRAVLAAGYPVTARRNHSYAVSYYKPLGLDATVYPPEVEMKFINDTPHYMLIQSFTVGNKAYYNFYGQKTNRTVHMIGPYYGGWFAPPAERVEYSPNLKPGETQVVGHAVPGVNVTWYRYVTYDDEMVQDEVTGEKENKSFIETIYSKYQARPNFYIVGEEAPADASSNGT